MGNEKLRRRTNLRIALEVFGEYRNVNMMMVMPGEFEGWVEEELSKISEVVKNGKEKSAISDTPGT